MTEADARGAEEHQTATSAQIQRYSCSAKLNFRLQLVKVLRSKLPVQANAFEAHGSDLFAYRERFRASGYVPEAWTVSRLSEQRRPLDLL